MKIRIIDAGNHEESLLYFLKERVEEIFKKNCYFSREEVKIDFAFVKERNQYLADILFKFLKISNPDGEKVVFLIEKDLFTPGYNFIFGKAELGGKFSIVSTARLFTEKKDVYYERCSKEVNHELGHNFGLLHCENENCVMFFSNTLSDTDRKSYKLCERCVKKYERL